MFASGIILWIKLSISMLLVILTKSIQGFNIFSISGILDIIKRYARYWLGKYRGPQAVTSSLISGLKELKVDFKLNPKTKEIDSNAIIYINESAEALRYAIGLKKQGKINKIVAGPVISILPETEGGIMLDPNIDLFLVPSDWTKDFWLSCAPQLVNKIVVWAAGIENVYGNKKKRDLVLVYYKNGPKAQLNYIVNFLKSKSIKCKVVYYGHYKKKDYYAMLDDSYCMIYLSESESQGLSLCESWMHDVPTLVWNRGFWKYCGHQWFNDKISAPYLTNECGMFFSGLEDFGIKWQKFNIKINTYKSRDYALKNFTNKLSAKKFIDLIKICFPNISSV